MLGPFATTSRLTPIHQVSPLYCRTPPAQRCPQRRQRRRRQRQRVTEGTAMAPWNGPNKTIHSHDNVDQAPLQSNFQSSSVVFLLLLMPLYIPIVVLFSSAHRYYATDNFRGFLACPQERTLYGYFTIPCLLGLFSKIVVVQGACYLNFV